MNTYSSDYERVLLQQFIPACLLVDEHLQVVYTHGPLDQYLRTPVDSCPTNLLPLLPDSLQAVFQSAIRQVKESTKPVLYQGVNFPVKEGVSHLNLKFSQVHTHMQESLVLIEFKEHTEEPEANFRRLLDNIPDAIVMYDRGLRIVFVNEGFEKQTGIPTAEMVGKTAQEIATIYNRPTDWYKMLEKVLHTKHIAEHTSLYQGAKGDQYFLTIMVPVLTQDQSGVESILTISRNITTLKHYESELEKSRQQWKSLLDNTPDMISRYDKDLKLQYINAAVERETGIPARQLIGKNPFEFEIRSENTEQFVEKVQTALQTGQMQHHISEYNPAGEKRYYLSTIVPESDNKNQPQTVLIISRNITGIKKHENELEASQALIKDQNEELKKVNEYLDNFVYAVAHDLRSPVANLLMLSEMLAGTALPDKSKQLVRATQESVQRLDKTLSGLVEVLEIQSVFRIQTHTIALSDVLMEVEGDLQELISQTGCCIQTNFTDCPSVLYIRSYLVSIFKNIISNAIKYRSESRPVQVDITSRRTDQMVLIEFRDNGTGIDLKKMGHKLFKPFSRLTVQGEGKGIGLYLIKNMIEKNGGRLEVQSTLPEGTTFTCYLKEYIKSATE